jgi:hypothetical protein
LEAKRSFQDEWNALAPHHSGPHRTKAHSCLSAPNLSWPLSAGHFVRWQPWPICGLVPLQGPCQLAVSPSAVKCRCDSPCLTGLLWILSGTVHRTCLEQDGLFLNSNTCWYCCTPKIKRNTGLRKKRICKLWHRLPSYKMIKELV